MKSLLWLPLVIGICATAVAAQEAPPPAPPPVPPPSSYMGAGPQDPGSSRFRIEDTRRACFNGRSIVGSNREGARILYVQPRAGGAYRLELREACEGLNAAEKLRVRADRDDVVCDGQSATLVLETARGPMQCAVREVRRLSRKEMALLAGSPRP
jgi:hypothetical protein